MERVGDVDGKGCVKRKHPIPLTRLNLALRSRELSHCFWQATIVFAYRRQPARWRYLNIRNIGLRTWYIKDKVCLVLSSLWLLFPDRSLTKPDSGQLVYCCR